MGAGKLELVLVKVTMGLPYSSDGKESACSSGDLDLIPGWDDPLEKGRAIPSSILPGESHGQRSLVGYRPWGHKESDMTEWLTATTKVTINGKKRDENF